MFEKPLHQKTIVITRAQSQTTELEKLLVDAGANVYACPMIQFVPTQDTPERQMILSHLDRFDGLMFTSVNGVHFWIEILKNLGQDVTILSDKPIFAIGPATAQALQEIGLKSESLPEDYRGESLASTILAHVHVKRLLFPRAVKAREVLIEALSLAGIEVTLLPVYETRPCQEGIEKLSALLWHKPVDMITFTSASTVTYLLDAFRNPPAPQTLSALWQIDAACLGPITAQTARRNGFNVVVEPSVYTIPSLVQAMIDYYIQNMEDRESCRKRKINR